MQAEELARARGHQTGAPGSSWPRSSARTRSTASSRLRHWWSSTRLRGARRDRPGRHPARVLLLVEVDAERQVVREAAVERDQAAVVRADEVDLAAGQRKGRRTKAASSTSPSATRSANAPGGARRGGCGGAGRGAAAGRSARRWMTVRVRRRPAPGRRHRARPGSRRRGPPAIVSSSAGAGAIVSALLAGNALAEPEQDHRDVVLAAALVGRPDERLAASSSELARSAGSR